MRNPDSSASDELKSGSNTLDGLEQMSHVIYAAAREREGDCLALLELLRRLNDLHYDIRETLFSDALPNNRQKLYRLLRDIEQEGGWPYIQRVKLRALLENIESQESKPDVSHLETGGATHPNNERGEA